MNEETKNINSVEPETVNPTEPAKELDEKTQRIIKYSFKPANERTAEETERMKEITRKGGLARQAQVQKRKTMQEAAKELLYRQLSRQEAADLLGQEAANLLNDDELNIMSVLNLKMCQESVQGNVRAFEAIRDTAGFSPKKEIELQADIMTDADRSLIDKISRRLGESG